MTGLGTLLQEARLKEGLTIEEMAERTKIRTQFLMAIEEGKLEELPDQAYVRAFLRTYARSLGVDPASIMLEYEARYVPTESEDVLSLRERRMKIRTEKRFRLGVALAITLGLVLIVYFLFRYQAF